MLSTSKKKSRKLTEEERRERRHLKQIREIQHELNKQYTIKNFHRIFAFESENSQVIREEELKTADEKIEVLTQQIRRKQLNFSMK